MPITWRYSRNYAASDVWDIWDGKVNRITVWTGRPTLRLIMALPGLLAYVEECARAGDENAKALLKENNLD